MRIYYTALFKDLEFVSAQQLIKMGRTNTGIIRPYNEPIVINERVEAVPTSRRTEEKDSTFLGLSLRPASRLYMSSKISL